MTVLYSLLLTKVGTFWSHMVDAISLHFYHTACTLPLISNSHPPSFWIIDPKYLNSPTCLIPSPLLSTILISSCSILLTIPLVFYALIVDPPFSKTVRHSNNPVAPSHLSLLLPNNLRTRGVIVSSLIRLGRMLYLSPLHVHWVQVRLAVGSN